MTQLANKSSWWKGMINVQTAFALGGAIVSVCFFIFRTNNNDKDINQLKKDILLKADKAETQALIKATDDKVNRQYDNNNKIMDRIIQIEKDNEYEKGKHDALDKK